MVLERARALGVQISGNGENLRVRGYRAAIEEVRALLLEHKQELLTVLRGTDPDEFACHWLIFPADGTPPTEMFFSPDPGVCRRELRVRFPGAALIPLAATAKNWRTMGETGLDTGE